jgi:Phosphatidylinositol-4-phosphate 5-Kinase
MLEQYYQHMLDHPDSLLVRITDFLHATRKSIGGLLRITPAHHIVMENILYGKEDDEDKDKWETFDLKPVSYFYPERDLAGGHLAPDSVKERLLDTFDDKLRVSRRDGQALIDQLSVDSKLLKECNVVDYSLFLVRYPKENRSNVSPLESRTSAWRKGVVSTDGRWIYRAVLLDYFWAKHKLHAQTMTGLIKGFNLVSGKGHMSITTTAEDYRKRFLRMVETLFETPEE